MPRLAPRMLMLITIGACGKDTGIEIDRPDSGEAAGDGSTRPGDDAGSPLPDGAPDAVCDEAKLHSDFAWLQINVLTPSCATAKCHSGPDPEVGLSLAAGAAYNNLVNK